MTPMRTHHALLIASGLAGLGFQVVWTRWFGLGLGHEMAGVIGVVGAFFLGLSVGAWLLDRPIARSARPGMWYVGLEVVIGVWALACVGLIPLADELAAALLGTAPTPLAHGLVATLVPALTLLPATVAMGATLPAMERFAARGGSERIVGGLYAANTAGAMVGTLAITFAVLPGLGFRATAMVLAGLNFACAGAAMAIGAGRVVEVPEAPGPDGAATPGGRRLRVTLFATGLLGIAYETLGVRMLNQFLENTVYTFAVVLSVYLAGTALGAAAYQRLLSGMAVDVVLGPVLASLGVACAGFVCTLEFARDIQGAVGSGGIAGAAAVEGVLAALVFLVPALLMGATFSCLAQAERGARGGLGRALAINTLGSALAPSLAGLVVAPLVGLKIGVLLVAAGYGALAVGRVRGALWPVAGGLSLALLLTSDLGLEQLDAGERVIARRDGAMATVTVTEDPGGARTLRVDGRFRMGGTRSTFLERRQGMIPLLLHPAPRRVLFLGVGSGTTVAAATFLDDVEAVGVELVPEVVELLPLFEAVNAGIAGHPRVQLVSADARRYARASEGGHDVIVADLFQPARDGAGALYTVEHFEAVRAALAEGGLFCQWLPLYQMDDEVVALVVRSFLEVFPDADAFLASFNVQTPALGLVGRLRGEGAGPPLGLDGLEGRLAAGEASAELARLALDDVYDLLGSRIAGPAGLAAIAGDGPLNTDDLPRVTFAAPRHVHAAASPGWTALEPFLGAAPPSAADLIGAAAPGVAERIEAYARARDAFLRGQIAMAEERVGDAIDRYVEATAASRDFQAGYVQAISLVNTAAGVPRERRLEAVRELARLRPERGDLRQLQRQLGG